MLRQLQKDLKEWQDKNFEPVPVETHKFQMLAGMQEELGEISHIILKSSQKIRKYKDGLTQTALADFKDGVGDLMVYTMQLCSDLGIDFQDAVETTAKEVMERNWKKNKDNGK